MPKFYQKTPAFMHYRGSRQSLNDLNNKRLKNEGLTDSYLNKGENLMKKPYSSFTNSKSLSKRSVSKSRFSELNR